MMRPPAPPRMDLTGHRYGRLLVESYASGYEIGRPKWNCLCDCGTRVVRKGEKLRASVEPTRSCGCLRVENMRKIGQQYGGRKVA